MYERNMTHSTELFIIQNTVCDMAFPMPITILINLVLIMYLRLEMKAAPRNCNCNTHEKLKFVEKME